MSKTIWLIDAAYLEKSSPPSEDFDYLKLKRELENNILDEPLYEAYYLNGSSNPMNDPRDSFYKWLKSATPNAPKIRIKLYSLKKQSVKCTHCEHQFERDIQKAVDVGIATLLITLATKNKYDRLLLSTGDGDFKDAISYVKDELNKEVWLLGYKNFLSPDLQCLADKVIWLNDFWDSIKK